MLPRGYGVLTTEDKLQLLGEQFILLNERVNKLCGVLRVVNQFHREADRFHGTDIANILKWGSDLSDWVEGSINAVDYKYNRLIQLDNRVTYLHNEVNEIKKSLGMMDGSAPTKRIRQGDNL